MAFFRSNLVNLNNLLVTVVIFIFILYIQDFKVNVPMYYKQSNGQQFNYAIKLFYL